jgi:hypothetical protein
VLALTWYRRFVSRRAAAHHRHPEFSQQLWTWQGFVKPVSHESRWGKLLAGAFPRQLRRHRAKDSACGALPVLPVTHAISEHKLDRKTADAARRRQFF